MKTIEEIRNGKKLCIEISEVWDFSRDIHSYQSNVVDKQAMHRYIIGKYKTCEIAEIKAREWILSNQ